MPKNFSMNISFREFLFENFPEYIEVVPHHWLEQERPSYHIQLCVSIFFLCIGIPGNFCQILVFVAYGR